MRGMPPLAGNDKFVNLAPFPSCVPFLPLVDDPDVDLVTLAPLTDEMMNIASGDQGSEQSLVGREQNKT